MKQWIRLKGLIAFVAALVLITVVWALAIDVVVRRLIEMAGTRVIGARVDLAQADLSLFPLGLTLTGLAVTDPDAPMRNAVEFERIKMDLDPAHLIKSKVIVNNMLVEGLTFNSARQLSGEVLELVGNQEEKQKIDLAGISTADLEKGCGSFVLPSIAQPDINAILAEEPLDAIKLVSSLNEKIASEQARWQKELTRLADEKTLSGYRMRMEKLKDSSGSFGALLGATREVQRLEADIRKDLYLLRQAQTAFTADLMTYQQQVHNLSRAPLREISLLVDKYSPSPQGLANLSQLIFGQKLCNWIQRASIWYRRINYHIDQPTQGVDNAPDQQEPLQGGRENARFAETATMPDFLIRNLKLDALAAAGNLSGRAENISLDQHILGSPMTFAFLGRAMKQMAYLSLSGSADYVKPEDPRNNVRLAIQGLVLENLSLIQEESLILTLKQATGELDLYLTMAGDGLDGILNMDVNAVRFISEPGDQQNAIGQAISSAISSIDRFSLSADISGTLEANRVDVTSDLDNVLKSAVSNWANEKTARFQAALKQKVTATLKGHLAQAQGNLATLDKIGAELSRRLNLGDELLKGLKLKN